MGITSRKIYLYTGNDKKIIREVIGSVTRQGKLITKKEVPTNGSCRLIAGKGLSMTTF